MQKIILKEVQTNYDDLRFGIIDILVDENTSKLYMRKVKIAQDHEEYSLDEKIVNKRFSIRHPNLLQMQDVEANEQKKTVIVYFEYPNEDIYDRKDKLKEIPEFVKFFYDIIAGLAALEKQSLVHGNLRPEYIYFNGENYVIADRLGDTSTQKEAQINNVKFGEILYQTPQMFENICNNKLNEKFNPFKEEIFNFGMMALSMLIDNEEDLQSCYDIENLKFKEDLFKDLIVKTKRKYFNNPQDKDIGDFLFYGILNPNQAQIFTPRKAHVILKRFYRQNNESVNSGNDQSIGQDSNQQITSVGQFYSENDFSVQNERVVESKNKLELKNLKKGKVEYEIDFEEEGNEVQQDQQIIKQTDKKNITESLDIVNNSGQHKMQEGEVKIQDSQQVQNQIKKNDQMIEQSDKPNVMILKSKKRKNQQYEIIFEDNVNENQIENNDDYSNKKDYQQKLTFEFEDQQDLQDQNQVNQNTEFQQDISNQNTQKSQDVDKQIINQVQNEDNQKQNQENNQQQIQGNNDQASQNKKGDTDSDFFQTIQINKTKDSTNQDRQQFNKTNGHQETQAMDDQQNNFFVPDNIDQSETLKIENQNPQQNQNSDKNSFEISSRNDFFQDQTNSYVTKNYSHTNNDNISDITKNTKITQTPLKINDKKQSIQIQSNKEVSDKEGIHFNKAKSIIENKQKDTDNRQQSQTYGINNKPVFQKSIELGEDDSDLQKQQSQQDDQSQNDLAFFQKNATKDIINKKIQDLQNQTRDEKAISFQHTKESRTYGDTHGFQFSDPNQQTFENIQKEEEQQQEDQNDYIDKLESQKIQKTSNQKTDDKNQIADKNEDQNKKSFYDMNCDEIQQQNQVNINDQNLYDSIRSDQEQQDQKSNSQQNNDDDSIKSYASNDENQDDKKVSIDFSKQREIFQKDSSQNQNNKLDQQDETRIKTNTQQVNSFYDNLKNYQIQNNQNQNPNTDQTQYPNQINQQDQNDNTKTEENVIDISTDQKVTIQTITQNNTKNIQNNPQQQYYQQPQTNSPKDNQQSDTKNQQIQQNNQYQQENQKIQQDISYNSQTKIDYTQDQLAQIYKKQQQDRVNSQRNTTQTNKSDQNIYNRVQKDIQPSRSPARKITRISIEGKKPTTTQLYNDNDEKFKIFQNQNYQKQESLPLKQDFGPKYITTQIRNPPSNIKSQRSRSQKISIHSTHNTTTYYGYNQYKNQPNQQNYIQSQNTLQVQDITNQSQKQSITTQNSTQQNYPGSQHYRPSQFSQRQDRPSYQQHTYTRQNRSPSPNYRQIVQQNNIQRTIQQQQQQGSYQQSVYDSKYNSQYVEQDRNKESIENLLKVQNTKFQLVQSEYQRIRVISTNFKMLLRQKSTYITKRQFHGQMILYSHEVVNFQQQNYKRFLIVSRNYSLVQHKFDDYIQFITTYYGVEYNRTTQTKISEKLTVYTRRVEVTIENNKIYNNYKQFTEGQRNTRQSVVTQQSYYPNDQNRIHVSNYSRQERSVDLKNEKKFGSKSPIRIKRITEEEYNIIKRNSHRSNVQNQSNRTVIQHPDLQKYKVVSNKSNQNYQQITQNQISQRQKDSVYFKNIEGDLVQSKPIVVNKIYNPGEELILSQETIIQNSQYSFYNENKFRNSQLWNSVNRGPYKKIAHIHYIKNIINDQGISESKTDLMEKYLPVENDDLVHLKDENGMKIYKYNSKKYIFKKQIIINEYDQNLFLVILSNFL